MKATITNQQGFVQIPILFAIVAALAIGGGLTFFGVTQYQKSKPQEPAPQNAQLGNVIEALNNPEPEISPTTIPSPAKPLVTKTPEVKQALRLTPALSQTPTKVSKPQTTPSISGTPSNDNATSLSPTPSTTTDDAVTSLTAQNARLQEQLNTLTQQSNVQQPLQQIQEQVAQQTHILNQIQQNTTTPTPSPLTSASPSPTATPTLTPTPIPTPTPTPTPSPAPRFVANITFDKSTIANDGIDAITVTIVTMNSLGQILPNQPILIYSSWPTYWARNLTSNSNGVVNTTITTTESTSGTRTLVVSTSNSSNADNYANSKSYQVIDTRATINFHADFGAQGIYSSVRGPAHDQPFAWFSDWHIPQTATNVKIKKIKLMVNNINSSWINNIRITNTPPCTQGVYCTSQQTVPLSAQSILSSDGLIEIIPTNPIDPSSVIWVIADTQNPTSVTSGTNYPLVTYTISLEDMDFAGNVNGYPSTQISYGPWQGTFLGISTINSNYCVSSSPPTMGQIIPCY